MAPDELAGSEGRAGSSPLRIELGEIRTLLETQLGRIHAQLHAEQQARLASDAQWRAQVEALGRQVQALTAALEALRAEVQQVAYPVVETPVVAAAIEEVEAEEVPDAPEPRDGYVDQLTRLLAVDPDYADIDEERARVLLSIADVRRPQRRAEIDALRRYIRRYNLAPARERRGLHNRQIRTIEALLEALQ